MSICSLSLLWRLEFLYVSKWVCRSLPLSTSNPRPFSHGQLFFNAECEITTSNLNKAKWTSLARNQHILHTVGVRQLHKNKVRGRPDNYSLTANMLLKKKEVNVERKTATASGSNKLFQNFDINDSMDIKD